MFKGMMRSRVPGITPGPFAHVATIAAMVLALALPASAHNRFVVVQTNNSDCGPAALATLLTYYLDVPAGEAEIAGLAHYQARQGTSLLGLEEAAVAKGCAADSFRMTFALLQSQLATYHTPVIVRTLNPEPHFAVVLAIEGEHIFMADPAAGNIVLPVPVFLKRWYISGSGEGYVFVAAGPHGAAEEPHRSAIVADLKREIFNLRRFGARAFMPRR